MVSSRNTVLVVRRVRRKTVRMETAERRNVEFAVEGGVTLRCWLPKELAGQDVGVKLIDKTNHHLFQPLLYQVATGGLSPADIAQPIRHILKNARNIKVVMGEVARIDTHSRQVHTTEERAVGGNQRIP
jgi:NADH:ubiquinone reductase (H+-translocating)